jgi:predicted nucleic acid-binding protein
MKTVVSDSSTLIAFLDCGRIGLLFDLFTEIVIAQEVYREITHKYDYRMLLQTYLDHGRLTVETVEHAHLYAMLIKRLDPGESESIVLAKERALPLIIDERKGRATAQSLQIPVIGTVGILLKLIDKTIVTHTEAIDIMQQLEANHFRLSSELKKLVYHYTGTQS